MQYDISKDTSIVQNLWNWTYKKNDWSTVDKYGIKINSSYNPNASASQMISTPKFATKLENNSFVFKDWSTWNKTNFTKYKPNMSSNIPAILEKTKKYDFSSPTAILGKIPWTTAPGIDLTMSWALEKTKDQAKTWTLPTSFTDKILNKPKVEVKKETSIIPTANAGNEYLPQLEYDIQNWATIEEIKSSYPELWWDDTLIQQLHYDISNWATLDEINSAYPELSWETTPTDTTTEWDWFFSTVWEWLKNLTWWVVSEVPWVLRDFVWFMTKVWWVPLAKWLSAVWLNKTWRTWTEAWNYIQGLWEEATKEIQNALWVDPEAFATQIWQFWTQIWSLFTGWWEAKIAEKFTEKAPQLVKWLENLATNYPKMYNTIKSALTWWKEMAKFDVVSEWEIKPEDVTIWAVTSPIIDLVWKWLVKSKDYLTKELPENLISSWIMNRADFTNISQRLAKLTWKEADPTDASRWLLNNINKADDKAWIRVQIQEWIKKDQNIASNLLKSDTKLYNTAETQELKKALREKLWDYWTFMKNWEFIPDAWQSKLTEEIISVLKWDKWLTLEQINKWRKILWDWLFNKQWTMKELARKEWWQNVWTDSSKFIENKIPWFRQANKNVEVWIAVNDAILKKETADLTKQILWGSAIWRTYWWATSWWDPIEILKSTLAWALIWVWASKTKDILISTKLKSKLALSLKSLWKEDKEIVNRFVSNWVITDWLNKVLKNLVSQWLSPNE